MMVKPQMSRQWLQDVLNVASLISRNTKEGLQRVSAAFVACCKQFAASYPAEFVEQELENLKAGFFRTD